MLSPALGILLLFQLCSGVLIAPLLTLLPVYVERELGLPPTFSANVRILAGIAGGAVALAGGALCDALGRKPAYLLAMTGVVAAGLLFLTDSPALIYALAVYVGLMFGLGTVAGLAYVMETSPRGSLALATGCYFLTGTLGNAAGSAASGWIAREVPDGYALLGGTMAAGHLLLLLAAWRLLPPLPRPEAPRTLAALTGGYGEFFRRAEVWSLLALRFLPTVYWGCVTFLMPLLLFRQTGSEKPAGYYTAASLLVSAACQLGAGRLIDRVGVRRPMLAAIVLVTAAALGQGLLTAHPAALIGFGLLGAGAAWSLSITMTTMVQELSREETRARLLGLTHVAWSGGFLAGTFASGYLARTTGLGQAPLAFQISAACCVLAVGCAVLVSRALPPPDGAGTG
jgi:MFS family permease